MIKKIFYSLPALAALIIMLAAFTPINGWIGHDFLHQFTRFVIGASHFWQNGFSVLHFTPYLCGGIGFFADPQSAYYSIPQLFTFWLEPWLATKLTLFLFYSIGYLGFVLLLTRIWKFSQMLAHFGALLFVTNGFAFGHLFVGHLTHHSYLLLPWFIYFILRPSAHWKTSAFWGGVSALSLILIYLLYSGSLHMLVVFALTSLLFAPLWWIRLSDWQQRRQSLLYLSLSVFFFVLAAGAKLYAIASYSPHFMIRGFDYSNENPLWILWRFFWFSPLDTPLSIKWGEFMFGPWEYIGFLSKVILPLSLVAAIAWAYSLRQKGLILLTALIAIEICALSVGWGGNEFLPFFSSYHNPIKFLAALIPLWILVALFGLQSTLNWYNKMQFSKKWIYPLLCLVVVFEFYFYVQFYTTEKIGLGFRYDPQVYTQAKAAGHLPPVKEIFPKVRDWQALHKGGSSMSCYEPLFGYRLEKMLTQIVPGPTDLVHQGAFNINNPACLVYPEQMGCAPWSRIAEADADNFTKFTNGETADWPLPWAQQILLYLAGFTVLILLLLLACSYSLRYGLRIRRF